MRGFELIAIVIGIFLVVGTVVGMLLVIVLPYSSRRSVTAAAAAWATGTGGICRRVRTTTSAPSAGRAAEPQPSGIDRALGLLPGRTVFCAEVSAR